MRQRPVAQPVEQVTVVRGIQHGLQPVICYRSLRVNREREQVQVMIAKYADRGRA